jgi:hypothetical protein
LQVKFTTAAVSISSRTFKATTRQLMVPLFWMERHQANWNLNRKNEIKTWPGYFCSRWTCGRFNTKWIRHCAAISINLPSARVFKWMYEPDGKPVYLKCSGYVLIRSCGMVLFQAKLLPLARHQELRLKWIDEMNVFFDNCKYLYWIQSHFDWIKLILRWILGLNNFWSINYYYVDLGLNLRLKNETLIIQ